MPSTKDPSRKVNERDTNLNNSTRDNNTPAGTAQNSMPQDELPALQRTPNAEHVAKQDTGRPSVRQPRGNKQLLDNAHLNRTGVPDPDRTGSIEVGTDDDCHMDEVRVAAVLNQVGTGMASALNQVGAVAVPHSNQPL